MWHKQSASKQLLLLIYKLENHGTWHHGKHCQIYQNLFFEKSDLSTLYGSEF